MTSREAVSALEERLRLGREQYSPKMFAKISGGLWPQIEAVLDELLSERKRADELDVTLHALGGVCPYCGARADLPPGHVERCYCLPAIRGRDQQISSLSAEVERLSRYGIANALAVIQKAEETLGHNFVEEFLQLKAELASERARLDWRIRKQWIRLVQVDDVRWECRELEGAGFAYATGKVLGVGTTARSAIDAAMAATDVVTSTSGADQEQGPRIADPASETGTDLKKGDSL